MVISVVAGGLEFTWGTNPSSSVFCKGFFVVHTCRSQFPQFRAAPLPSGPVVGGLHDLLVESSGAPPGLVLHDEVCKKLCCKSQVKNQQLNTVART